jgi:hypothetical protein
MTSTVTIQIDNPDTHPALAPVRINLANKIKAEIPFNTPTPIDERLLPLLRDAGHDITILEQSATPAAADTDPAPIASDAEGEDGGDSASGGGAAAEDSTEQEPKIKIDPEFLDRSVKAIIPDLADKPAPELQAILAAETAGKTRKSLITEIETLIAAKTQG